MKTLRFSFGSVIPTLGIAVMDTANQGAGAVAYVYLRRNRKKNVLVVTQAGDAIPAVSSLAERPFRTSGDALDALNAAV
jgi:hypothetical protein